VRFVLVLGAALLIAQRYHDPMPCRHRQDSNLRGLSPMDFESISLTARTQCHNFFKNGVMHNKLGAFIVKRFPD
jgi:hypothetical protein